MDIGRSVAVAPVRVTRLCRFCRAFSWHRVSPVSYHLEVPVADSAWMVTLASWVSRPGSVTVRVKT